MKKKEKPFTYCFGTGCPDKELCLRYKEKINKKREDFFAVTPYDDEKKKCGFIILKSDDITDPNGEGGTNN